MSAFNSNGLLYKSSKQLKMYTEKQSSKWHTVQYKNKIRSRKKGFLFKLNARELKEKLNNDNDYWKEVQRK